MEFTPSICADLGDASETLRKIPERGLISAVITLAVLDSNSKSEEGLGNDAMDFLMTTRSNPYFELLGIDPVAARENLIHQSNRFPHFEVFRNRFRRWRKVNSKLLAMEDV